MVERKRRKKNRVRGHRTHAKGNTKNRRGAGIRGGRGNAGSNKHKFHSIVRVKEARKRLKPKNKGNAISLGSLDEKIEELKEKGKVYEEEGMVVVGPESGYSKVLGQGDTEKKLLLRINATKEAIKKIQEKGGLFDFEKKGAEKPVEGGEE